MKITIDTENKTIEALEPVKLAELKQYLGASWQDYSVVPTKGEICDAGLG